MTEIYCATEMIAKHFPPIAAKGKRCICALCGKQTEKSLPISSLKKTFTNHDLLRYGTEGFCPACVSCLRRELLFTNFIVTEQELIKFKRDEIIRHLFDPPEPPFIFCITQSYKKHNAIRSEISWSRESFHVRMEDLSFFFEPQKWRVSLTIITEQIKVFSKKEIKTGDYAHRRIMDYGLKRLLAEEQILKPLRGLPQFDLLIYAFIKPEKQDKQCQTSNNSENKQEILF